MVVDLQLVVLAGLVQLHQLMEHLQEEQVEVVEQEDNL
tara:strand:- start:141 stop:254 length:114 start_codon:yes stop_codon:yes gene_type:complete